MTVRQMLRWWLRGLRATAVAVDEALLSLPTVTPDRTRYDRPDCGSLDAVMVWMVYERSSGWWQADTHKVRDAAVYWLAMRERLTGVRS